MSGLERDSQAPINWELLRRAEVSEESVSNEDESGEEVG